MSNEDYGIQITGGQPVTDFDVDEYRDEPEEEEDENDD